MKNLQTSKKQIAFHSGNSTKNLIFKVHSLISMTKDDVLSSRI